MTGPKPDIALENVAPENVAPENAAPGNVPPQAAVPQIELSEIEAVEDDDEASLPQPDEDAAKVEEGEAGEGSLAAGRAAIVTHLKLAPSAARRLPHDRCARRRALCRQGQEPQEARRRLCAADRARHPHRAHDRGDRARSNSSSPATETEALLLEANLIKRLRPRFNVLLRDDKSFPYILITARPSGAADPQASRRAHAAGQLFRPVRLGRGGQPHHQLRWSAPSCCAPARTRSSRAARGRACSIRSSAARRRAPARSTFADYAELVREANAFLSGRSQAVKEELAAEMEKASAALDFERAALYRDRLAALVGNPGAPGHQSARRRGGRRLRRASAGRLFLRRGLLLPHRAELGQSRLFPQGRSLAGAGEVLSRIPRPVLRRQAAARGSS